MGINFVFKCFARPRDPAKGIVMNIKGIDNNAINVIFSGINEIKALNCSLMPSQARALMS